MSICPKCHTQVPDNVQFCTKCGAPLNAAQPGYSQAAGVPQGQPGYPPQAPVNYGPQSQPVMPAADPYDHTAEFDPQDISDNKVYILFCYLLSYLGIGTILMLLISDPSPYVKFHRTQLLKIDVSSLLGWVVMWLTCWLLLPIVAALVFELILVIVRIICFFQVCGGKAKEAPIVRSFGFLH